jgi:hypothetical protein
MRAEQNQKFTKHTLEMSIIKESSSSSITNDCYYVCLGKSLSSCCFFQKPRQQEAIFGLRASQRAVCRDEMKKNSVLAAHN